MRSDGRAEAALDLGDLYRRGELVAEEPAKACTYTRRWRG